MKKKLTIIIFLLLIISVLIFLIIPKKKNAKQISKLTNSVFQVNNIVNNQVVAFGTGFLLFDESTIATNYHVIDGAEKIQISEGSATCDVDYIEYFNKDNDLVLLHLTQPINQPVIKADFNYEAKQGEKVYAIGNPEGLNDSLSEGIISSIRNDDSGMSMIQITTPISHGSSGGVLLNEYGLAIGITSAGYEEGQNLNFAIPLSYLNNIKKSEYSLQHCYSYSRNYGTEIFNDRYMSNCSTYDGKFYFLQGGKIHEMDCNGVENTLDIETTAFAIYKDYIYFYKNESTDEGPRGSISRVDYNNPIKENIELLHDFSISKMSLINKLIVTKAGIFITDRMLCKLVKYNWNYEKEGIIDDIKNVYLTEDLLIGQDDTAENKVVFVNQNTLDVVSESVGVNYETLYVYHNNGNLILEFEMNNGNSLMLNYDTKKSGIQKHYDNYYLGTTFVVGGNDEFVIYESDKEIGRISGKLTNVLKEGHYLFIEYQDNQNTTIKPTGNSWADFATKTILGKRRIVYDTISQRKVN